MGTKITSMSAGAIDPIAQSKRVFYRPTVGETVKVGDAVCYNSDIAGDHKERGVGSDPPGDHIGGDGTDYAEGNQTYTGRLFIVERPEAANLHRWAGIVKCLGPKAGADGDMIEIWVPNGAVVPCRILDVDCAIGTIVSLVAGLYTLGPPKYGTSAARGRAIGVCQEGVTRTSVGMCWVQISDNFFINQGYGVTNSQQLQLSADCDVTTTLNRTFVRFLGITAGEFELWRMRGQFEGEASGAPTGMIRIEAVLNNAVSSGDISALCACAMLKTGAVLTSAKSMFGVDARVEKTDGTATTTGTYIAALRCHVGAYYTWGTAEVSQMKFTQAGNDSTVFPDYWFVATHEAIKCAVKVGSPAVTHTIKVKISGADRYIMVSTIA